jgi:hypothetical protein
MNFIADVMVRVVANLGGSPVFRETRVPFKTCWIISRVTPGVWIDSAPSRAQDTLEGIERETDDTSDSCKVSIQAKERGAML